MEVGNLVRIIPNNGKANHFYINDIYENEMEEESMMTLDSIMANMPMEEREIIMDKMVAASRDILETIADMGYLDEYEDTTDFNGREIIEMSWDSLMLIRFPVMAMNLAWIWRLEFLKRMRKMLIEYWIFRNM
ncbi:MAG: hypothetical protein ACLSGK_10280 [Lachnospiraceae bacterium]